LWIVPDPLGTIPVDRVAMLRLAGDDDASTSRLLDVLYATLSSRGFVIVDDYDRPGCRHVVDDFRARHRIPASLERLDGGGVYWRKT
jgi:hypothetical protein